MALHRTELEKEREERKGGRCEGLGKGGQENVEGKGERETEHIINVQICLNFFQPLKQASIRTTRAPFAFAPQKSATEIRY